MAGVPSTGSPGGRIVAGHRLRELAPRSLRAAAGGRGVEVAEDMERVCAGCGYRSGNQSFFRREKSGVFGRRRAFCHGCVPYEPTRLERASVQSVWLFAVGALLVASGVEGPPHGIGYLWVF